MKYLFFLLVVVNIVFYLWETGVGHEKPRFDRVELRLPDETDRIALIKELPAIPYRSAPPMGKIVKGTAIPEQLATSSTETSDEEANTAATRQPAASATPTPVDPTCFRLGPYRTEAAARAALESIGERLPGAEVVPGLAETVTGYWVLYPKAESVEAAKLNRKMLMSKGISELWLFDKGELAGAISLGLYQTSERAEMAQKRFFAQNLKVEVVPRLARSQASWLQFHWEGARDGLEMVVAGIQNKSQATQAPQLKNCE